MAGQALRFPHEDDRNVRDIHIHINVGGQEALSLKLDGILAQLAQLKLLENKILMTEQEASTLLNKVDATTTKMGTSVQAEADTLQKISDEVDALVAAGQIPASVASRLTTLADSLQGVSDNLDTHAGILNGILAKGQPVVPDTPVPAPTELPPA